MSIAEASEIYIAPSPSTALYLGDPAQQPPVVLLFALESTGDQARWLSVPAYEDILGELTAENAPAEATWEPDTPESAAERAEITEALAAEQWAVIARRED